MWCSITFRWLRAQTAQDTHLTPTCICIAQRQELWCDWLLELNGWFRGHHNVWKLGFGGTPVTWEHNSQELWTHNGPRDVDPQTGEPRRAWELLWGSHFSCRFAAQSSLGIELQKSLIKWGCSYIHPLFWEHMWSDLSLKNAHKTTWKALLLRSLNLESTGNNSPY